MQKSAFHPIELSRELESRYRDYLDSMFQFRDPELRMSFRTALDNGGLRKGPYLESMPVFERAKSLRQVLGEMFDAPVEDAFVKALNGDRPLYLHQERAIRNVASGRNTVVATGTGSGKTEAFLYPILAHLFEEHLSGTLGDGVRALILYPMNALVNDQRERLGDIARRLLETGSSFHFTFGQYVGETPENRADRYRDGNAVVRQREETRFSVLDGDHVVHGEMVLRQEMRSHPPHVLLTNFSMLEYLLLRPTDSPLFDGGPGATWRFFVLDEAHQYRGTKGMEMALLLRRLKQRLRDSGTAAEIRCIATSATLLDDDGGTRGGAEFAELLFDEQFLEADVITGERIAPRPHINPQYEQLRKALAGGPGQLDEVGELVFPGLAAGECQRAVVNLVAEMSETLDGVGSPLLRARYHLFLRSLEGAFLRLHPTRQVFLDRGGSDHHTFEVALCRECGQHHLVGVIRGNRLVEPVRDPGHPDFRTDFFRPLDAHDTPVEGNRTWWLCGACGRVGENKEAISCDHDAFVHIEQVAGSTKYADRALRCSACGWQGDDPIREVVYGNDGPHAVLATTLFNQLPPNRSKILAFADGRQEAAYFAWFVGTTYDSLLKRHLLLRSLTKLSRFSEGEPPSLEDLAFGLRPLFVQTGLIAEHETSSQALRATARTVWSEFLPDQARTTLEGVGLAAWICKLPTAFSVPTSFFSSPWDLTESDARSLVGQLLSTLRIDGAVDLCELAGVDVKWDELDSLRQQSAVQLGSPGGATSWKSWDGPKGRRADYLARILLRKGVPTDDALAQSADALRRVWQALDDYDHAVPPEHRLLVHTSNGRRLNARWWRLRSVDDQSSLYRCEACQRIQAVSVAETCFRYKCEGRLVRVGPSTLDFDPYRRLYEGGLRGPFRAEEHTAQLAAARAKQYQNEFKDGKIDLLSCSTTFEVGVDLGDLDVVFLRNIPPEAFNYTQRVGRAGRRDAPGFAVSYCRRSSHDLYHYADPSRMLSGNTAAPRLRISNPRIATRHMVAIALSSYFRAHPDRFQSVQAFVGSWDQPTAQMSIAEFLARSRVALSRGLFDAVPIPLHSQLGLEDGSWPSRIVGLGTPLDLAVTELAADVQLLNKLEDQARADGRYNEAKWAQQRLATLSSENVLSFLSRKAVIPKYGFPVDVVELQPLYSEKNLDVSFQRDLAIAVAEFAPGSSLIANKRVWTSYGVKRVPGKEWPRYFYVRCQVHNTLARSQDEAGILDLVCCSQARVGTYIDPIFGFVTNRQSPKQPRQKPRRRYTTRPHFAGFEQASDADRLDLGFVKVRPAASGRLVVLCEGSRQERFYVCSECGAGFAKRPTGSHKTPYGRDCTKVTLGNGVALGHEFTTDVLELSFVSVPADAESAMGFAYSLAYALVEGAAEALEIPSSDLNTTVTHLEPGLATIVLYDNVPGGAGLVASLEEPGMLHKVLGVARKRVSGACGCDASTSCYGCLRTYGNQFIHPELVRGPVEEYLSSVLAP